MSYTHTLKQIIVIDPVVEKNCSMFSDKMFPRDRDKIPAENPFGITGMSKYASKRLRNHFKSEQIEDKKLQGTMKETSYCMTPQLQIQRFGCFDFNLNSSHLVTVGKAFVRFFGRAIGEINEFEKLFPRPVPLGQDAVFFEETICDELVIVASPPDLEVFDCEEVKLDEPVLFAITPELFDVDLTDYSLIPEGMWTEYVSHFIKSIPAIIPQHCDTSIMTTTDFVNVMRACGMAASGQRKGGKKKGKHKKIPGKRKNQKSDYSTSIVRGPASMANLMPDTKLMWLEYNNPTTVILTAAASNFALLNLHPNDLFRPVVGTATQYTGLTAMETFYNYYLVKKWQLNLEFINADAVPKEVFVIPTPQDLTGTVTTPATAQFYVGSRGVPSPKLVSATGGMDRATSNYSMNCSRFYGDRVEYDTSYNAVTSGSPANFLNCALVAVTTTANMTFGLMVRLKMRAQVKFYQRKAVA